MLDTTHIQKSAKTIRDSVELFFNQLKPFAELETIEQKQEYHLKGLLQSAVTVLEPSKETFLRLQRSGLTNDISFALINYEQLYTRCKFLLRLSISGSL